MSIPGDPFRRNYGALTEEQKSDMHATKIMYEHIWEQLGRIVDSYGPSRDISVAKTELQNSCMWAVRAITKLPDQE